MIGSIIWNDSNGSSRGLTLRPETEPARTLEFGRWKRRQDGTEAGTASEQIVTRLRQAEVETRPRLTGRRSPPGNLG